MNDGVGDVRGFWRLLTSPKRLVIEAHYVVIPAYIYVNRVARGLKWNRGRYARGDRMGMWGGVQFMAFISVVSVHIVNSVAHFGVFIPQ